MSQSIIFMYSGQGSQYYHMAKALFQNNDIFNMEMKRINEQVYNLIGESALDVLYDSDKGFSDCFNRTLYTHICTFMVECALTKVLLHSGVRPTAVIGASLGEFAAAVTAGVWEMEKALQAVVKQAELLESCCDEGGMLTILYDYSLYSSSPQIYENCELASVNYRNHFIVSGKSENISKVENYVKSKGITSQRLPVVEGFHSSVMDPIAEKYLTFLNNQSLQNPKIPFISSLYGKQIDILDNVYFWHVTREPIKFSEAISYLLGNVNDGIYLDLGPSGTLVNLMKHVTGFSNGPICMPIITPFHQEIVKLDEVLKLFESQ